MQSQGRMDTANHLWEHNIMCNLHIHKYYKTEKLTVLGLVLDENRAKGKVSI